MSGQSDTNIIAFRPPDRPTPAPKGGLVPVAEARTRIGLAMRKTEEETVPLAAAFGRVLAADTIAVLSHPPEAVSAMDGYALRSTDAVSLPATLLQIGVSRAGTAYRGSVEKGQCVRIFTGAVVPKGADTIALQEDAEEESGRVTLTAVPPVGRFIRPAGFDVPAGGVVMRAGQAITARALGLLATAGIAQVRIRRRPRVAILSTGDELVEVGQPVGPDQIVDTNRIALIAAVTAWGGTPIDLGHLPDREEAISAVVDRAMGADLLVSSGGASVGDHDVVRAGLAERGFVLDFWRIAMRPGKPLMFGRIGDLPVLGLPGNPVSAMVCALLFLRPAIAAMLGRSVAEPEFERAVLAGPIPANDQREDYLRAEIGVREDGVLAARPFIMQDSAMLASLAWSQGLVRRKPFAAAANAGETVEVLRFGSDLAVF
jgi:molybdopterin molybdotransferase